MLLKVILKKDGVHDLAVKKLKNYKTIFEVGSGNEIGTVSLKTRLDNVITSDISPAMKPDYVCDARNMDIIKDNSFDAVFSSHCLEHIKYAENALKEIVRVVKPGGYCLIIVPKVDYHETTEYHHCTVCLIETLKNWIVYAGKDIDMKTVKLYHNVWTKFGGRIFGSLKRGDLILEFNKKTN